MKLAKLTIIFIFLICCSSYVCSQTEAPKLGWKNIEANYDSFYKIEPFIVNNLDVPIYFDQYYSPVVEFEKFDESTKTWFASNVWHCGTGYKPSIVKLGPAKDFRIGFLKEDWDEITFQDSIGVPKFKQLPGYNGSGRYRFIFRFGLQKRHLDTFVSYSPEFMVIESNFVK